MQPFEIFRSGRHTAVSGATLSFGETDLTAIATAYDPALHHAPIVVGHPSLDAPAYGWIDKLSVSGDRLVATPRDVEPAFADLVKFRRFQKVSASFYRPDSPNNPAPGGYYLRHVGFLGAVPPAVKGLKPVEFADGEDILTVEFGDPAPVPAAPTAPTIPSDDPKETSMPAAELAAREDALKAREAELDRRAAAFAEAEAARRVAADTAELDALAAAGRLPKTARPIVDALFAEMRKLDTVIDFADGGGTVKTTPRDLVVRLLKALPPPVPIGEIARGEAIDFADSSAVHAAIEAEIARAAKSGETITAATAATRIKGR